MYRKTKGRFGTSAEDHAFTVFRIQNMVVPNSRQNRT